MTSGSDRRQPRIPIKLAVEYRTTGAFLVSYSVNLSKGGIFLETDKPLAIDATVELQFDVPGAGLLTLEGHVAWVRQGGADGLPDGMGVQFADLDMRYGKVIDEMVQTFLGLTVLVVAASHERLSLIKRYVQSIISCEVVEATDEDLAEVALEGACDLVVVDLDLEPDIGMRTIANTRARDADLEYPTPIILLAGDPEVRPGKSGRRRRGAGHTAVVSRLAGGGHHDAEQTRARQVPRLKTSG